MTAFYVYGFVDQPLKPFTIAGHRIEVVTAASLYAAVERVSERPALSEAFLRLQHQITQRLSTRARAVLPARFGAFVDGDELTRLATRRGDELMRGLAHVTDRAQMIVRLLLKEEHTNQEDEGPEPATGTEYLHRRKAAVSVPAPGVAATLCAAVAALVVDTRIESRAKPRLTTIVHLVPKTGTSAYRRLMRRAAQTLREDVRVSISGPQAPFAFVPEIWP
jgi:hypothetical protein